MMKRPICILLCAALALTSCERARNLIDGARSGLHKVSASDSVTVRVIHAGNEDMSWTDSYVGTVSSSKTSIVTCPAPGTVTAVYVRDGQRVRAGEQLARIESQSLVSAHEMAAATLVQARDAMERLQKVYGSGSVSELRMVEMKTDLAKAEASERAAAKALEDCVVKAPFSGVVDGLDISAGEDSEFARVLMRIVDPSAIEIHFPLPENEYRNVSVGDEARVAVPAIGSSFSARVAVKGAVASALSHSYDCTVAGFGVQPGLMPGMVCKISLDHGNGSGTVIPSSSVMTDNGGRYVWVVRNGVVAKTYIEVGGYSGNGIVASSGLEEGDAVIVEGARKVSGGMSVKIIE